MFVLYVSAGACDKPQHAIQSQYVKKKDPLYPLEF